jgi:hypothetical protein
MANVANLEKAYATIGALLAKGLTKLSVNQIATASGLARQTFYQQDEEWKEVRAVIKGKPSPRVKLVQVEIKQKSESAKKIEELIGRVDVMEQEVNRIEGLAGKVYEELIDELQRWFYVAAESPKKKTQVAQYLEELNNTSKELERVKAENRLLRAERDCIGTLRALNQKKIIDLPALAKPGDLFADFLRQYKSLVSSPRAEESLTAVYILCGLPYSGKTTWITKHQLVSPGTHIYVDSCAPELDIRRFIANQIQSSSNAQIHCVWVRTDQQACSERSAIALAGAANALKQQEIKAVAKEFETPSLDENFNSVILA